MEHKSNDLFLLMAHLAQINETKNLMKLFTEGLNGVFEPVKFSWSSHENKASDKCIEIKTRFDGVGYLNISEKIDSKVYPLFQNTLEVFRVYAERIQQQQKLENKQVYLEEKIKERANELLENENKFKNAITNAPFPIMIHADGNVLQLSNEWTKITGFTINHIPTIKEWTLNAYGNKADTSQEFINKLYELEGLQYDGEWEIKTKKGDTRIWDFSTSPIGRLSNGKKIVISMAVDITERKKNEKELHKSQEIFKTFMEHSPIYVFFKDENIRPIHLSKNYEAMLNKPIHELLGKNMYELFPSDLAKSIVADDLKILKENKEVRVEEELNGRYYNTIKFPIHIEGKPAFLAGYTIDITEEKMARIALEKSEAKLRGLFENINAGIVVHAADTSVLMSNALASKLLGLSRDQMQGKKAIDPAWDFLDEDNQPMPLSAYPVNTILATKQPLINLVLGIIQSKGETVKWVLVNGFPINNEKSEIIEVVISFVDITDLKNTEKLLKSREEELRKHRDMLEEIVSERTLELEIKNQELDRSLKVFVGRELTIKNLQNKIRELEKR